MKVIIKGKALNFSSYFLYFNSTYTFTFILFFLLSALQDGRIYVVLCFF